MKSESPDGFNVPKWTTEEIRRALPPSVFKHRPSVALATLARDLIMAALFLWAMVSLKKTSTERGFLMPMPMIWPIYWWFQGLVFTGLWVIGHECAHESFLPYKRACVIIGFGLHSLLWTPHLSWKATHRIHHHYHGHMVHDQHWVPPTRSQVNVERQSFLEYLEDTPIFVLAKLVIRQMIGFQSYLLLNLSGPRHYPVPTSHFNPYSIMFKSQDRASVLVSDMGILAMVWITSKAVQIWGLRDVFMFYGIPCLIVSHWVTMIVYLHHTDPVVPHYRESSWTYTRGALATVDRDFLGWQGRFFLHDVSIHIQRVLRVFSMGGQIAHFHVVHHLFPRIPFYNAEAATQHVQKLIGTDYHMTSEPVFKSLWKNYRTCHYVEDEGKITSHRSASTDPIRPGDVVFYKTLRWKSG
ncbi:fatty acid desaturase-domain-containing protein [Mycena galericulata]|nr:fatty acid desaturase-domain-containing protein [Mycena galericulata]